MHSAESPSVEMVACPVCDNASEFAPVRSARLDHYIEEIGVGLKRSLWATCKRCGCVMQNPRPNRAAYDRLYGGGAYHAITDTEIQDRFRVMRHRFERKVAQVAALLPEGGSRRLLDIGCGMGEVLKLFGERGVEAVGVQPDSRMAQLAREHFGVNAVTGYFGPGLFPDNHFGLVFSNHVVEHLEQPLEVANAISAVLEPGGVCVTYVPTFFRNRTWAARAGMNSAHNWMFTHHTLGTLFKRAGLVPVDHAYSDNDKDELLLVVRKPVDCPTAFDLDAELASHPSWKEVKRYHDLMIDARAIAYLPQQLGNKARTFAEVTQFQPSEIAAWVRRMVQYRTRTVQLFARSLRRTEGVRETDR